MTSASMIQGGSPDHLLHLVRQCSRSFFDYSHIYAYAVSFEGYSGTYGLQEIRVEITIKLSFRSTQLMSV